MRLLRILIFLIPASLHIICEFLWKSYIMAKAELKCLPKLLKLKKF